ncbi:hypothetical protein [Desulfohalobium retbaense]|uniref:Uncharacterized protein n=1 Tax=Desulfohalobium retbaense (strain ATCC 49708 / DSM 5692 / JCM 16813 / HR100) TaxID=485915 RepID=C8X5W2_DESRD|nr:hypothetical protein [Desulfohalobium retbaense]ACV69809.1 hypothetical protein Dret_2531 [Desulfohalobium retbaense DSM 5692]
MGEFIHIAENIAGHINHIADNQKISIEELGELATEVSGKNGINIYPGIKGAKCHTLSIFISLSSPAYVKGMRGHLSFRQAIEKMVQHMQGTCINKTNIAILITDNWDPAALEEWRDNLHKLATAVHIETYLISGKNVSEIYV